MIGPWRGKGARPEPVKGFCTDVWFDYAKRFIATQKKAGKPFFAYISTNAPHNPIHSPESFSAPYQDLGTKVANFFGMIANIDDNVGRLRSFLDQEGLTKNTIFIFTTDNGSSAGDLLFNAGMRGKKGSEYDGGHRVPFFIHWPAEADTAITASLEAGEDVPGELAYCATPGKALPIVNATLKIGGQEEEKPVPPGAKDVVFNLELGAGATRLTARFISEDGEMYGGYYATIKRH